MANENKNCKILTQWCERLDKCKHYQKFSQYRDQILALSNDSLQKTIAIALTLCFVCAILVSISAVALKPLQIANKAMDMKKNILEVAGLLTKGANIHQIFADKIEAKLVDISTGDYVEAVEIVTYDQRKSAKNPAQNIIIPRAKDIASIKTKAKIAKVYLVKEAGKVKSIILPIHGYGLWSTLYGFLALEADGQTVQSINFYDQAETPGLGGEVVNPNWRALWAGKKVYTESGDVALTVIKGTVDASKSGAEFQVDGLAGATITSKGVSNLIKYWMSDEGFAAYLKKITTAS
jgi:Na+-transporting NADH:ubiquinone oxidoreductase subunit C